MTLSLKRIAALGMAAILGGAMMAPAAWSQTAAKRTERLPAAKPPLPTLRFAEQSSGQKAINNLGRNVAAVAAHYGKAEKELRDQFLRDKTLRLDKTGRLLFVEQGLLSPGNDLATPGATYPPERTFFLHSRPSSKRKIYLDFNGQVLSGTAADGTYSPFDTDGIPGTFSASELATIQAAWKRMAEDFAPFDVDVTTEEPTVDQMTRSSLSDDTFGIRVLITKDTKNCGCGGWAYVGVFDNTSEYYKVAVVFATSAASIAAAGTHEVGHTLGLSHDGTTSSAYYWGHDDGKIAWVPIMGAGYDRGSLLSLTQFSKGEYLNANNLEDDYLVIQNNGVTFAPDDFGSTTATASALIGTSSNGTTSYDVKGLIGTPSDIDMFKFDASAGPVNISATPFEVGANLDILLQLADANGNVIAMVDPVDRINTTLSASLPARGTYYVSVQGTGKGDPLGTGYSSYGSIGRYTLSVNAPSTVAAPVAGITTSAASGPAPLTVSFSGASSTDPSGTLQGYEWNFGDGSAVVSGLTANHAYAAAGTYEASLKVTSSSGLSNSNSVTITVSSPNVKMSVDSIAMSLIRPQRGQPYARAAVTVRDVYGRPVPGATVNGAWSGIVSGTSSAITNASGVATSNAPSTKKSGTIKYSVNSITAPGYAYDANLNKMTTNAITK